MYVYTHTHQECLERPGAVFRYITAAELLKVCTSPSMIGFSGETETSKMRARVCVCLCASMAERKMENDREIYFKELAQVIMGVDKSEILNHAGDPGKRCVAVRAGRPSGDGIPCSRAGWGVSTSLFLLRLSTA